MGTIIIPIITISTSIAFNGPHLLFSFGEDYIAQKKTGTIVALCLICGPFIPLFILRSLQTTLRKAKRCARRKDQHANNLFEKLTVKICPQKTLPFLLHGCPSIKRKMENSAASQVVVSNFSGLTQRQVDAMATAPSPVFQTARPTIKQSTKTIRSG